MTDSKNIAYVRDAMVAEQAPPATQSGPIRWVRENLLSSWLNIILTIIALWAVWSLLSSLVPWIWNGVWHASSLSECRDIISQSPRVLAWNATLFGSAETAVAALPNTEAPHRLIVEYLANSDGYTGALSAGYDAAQFAAWREAGEIGPALSSTDGLSHLLERVGYGVGERPTAACWAVLSDRWHQLVFGYYSKHGEYWRPVLALLVFLAGVMPILFTALPRKLLIFTGLVPFICYFLIWGGSIWYPVSFLAGLAIGYAVFTFATTRMMLALSGGAAVLAALLYFLFVHEPLYTGLHSIIPIGLPEVPSRDIGGFALSVIIGLSAILLSLPLGILLALGRQSDMFLINKMSVVFIEVIRGVPLIVWLFTAQLLLNYFLPPGTNFDLTLRVIIMVTFFSSAYIAEVIRGGLAALPKGQYEGGDSLGLNYWQSMRLVVLPQALKISIPGIVNTFIGLFKDTTLVLFIGLYDPLGIAGAIRATTDWNGIYWELFMFIGLMFFIACFSMGRYSLYLERKLRREHR